jgi:tetratricopeptide (TPR) repeat protein
LNTAIPSKRDHVFIGRENEIKQLFSNICSAKSITLIRGEFGIGKSSILDEFYKRLKKDEHQKNALFIGYYDGESALITESQSLIYPFNIVLGSLLKGANESEQFSERTASNLTRLQRAIIKFAKEQGKEMAEAIIEDVARKAGLENVLKVSRGLLSAFRSQKSSLMLAEDYLSKYKEDALHSYLGILQSIADEFKERSFVLIFDEIESTGKASIDFLLNLAKFLPDRFHIVVSINTVNIGPSTTSKLYEDIKDKLIEHLNGNELAIEGLSAEDIGKWIKRIRGISLPLMPDLQRIKENSAGLPLLLDEWITKSNDLKYEEIRRDHLCDHVLEHERDLNDDDLINLYKISVLIQPLKDVNLARYLQINNIDLLRPFTKKLIERRIFDEKYRWFRHELIRRCFEDDLAVEEKTRYHNKAADFYRDLSKEKKNSRMPSSGYEIFIAYAYHLHNAGSYEESYIENTKLARHAAYIGDLDLAERSYTMAIDDAQHLHHHEEEMKCLLNLSSSVYFVWGRYYDAYSNYQKLLEYFSKLKDIKNQAIVLNDMAKIHHQKNEYDEALKLYNESLDIAKEAGYYDGIARALHNIGLIHYIKNEYDEALKLYNESLDIARKMGIQDMVSKTLHEIAIIHQTKGQYDEALKLYNESLDIARKMGDRHSIERELHSKGIIHSIKGQYDEALKLYNESLDIARKMGIQDAIIKILLAIASVHSAKQEYDEALKLYNESLDIARQLGDKSSVSNIDCLT